MISRVWGGVDCPVTQAYGPNHRGIDIGMGTGHPLFAARSGVVAQVGPGYLCLTVGDNLRDWYLHISRCLVRVGDQVTAGNFIAEAGMVQVPGGPPPTGPHLHFEVQRGHLDVFATSLDPVPVLLGAEMELDIIAKRTFVLLAYAAGLGRTPEDAQRRDGWANSIQDDGSNLDAVVTNILNSKEGIDYRAAVRAALKAAGGLDTSELVTKAALQAAIDKL